MIVFLLGLLFWTCFFQWLSAKVTPPTLATSDMLIQHVNKTYVANVTKINGESSIVFIKFFFLAYVEELYCVFSAYA